MSIIQRLYDKLRPLTFRKVLVIVLAVGFLFSVVKSLLGPASQRPFSLGLPSPMETFVSDYEHFAIDHPESWFVADTPGGSHGDKEIVAIVTAPGPTFSPKLIITRRNFPESDISQVAAWGEERANQRGRYTPGSLKNMSIPNFDGLLREYTFEYGTFFGTFRHHCEDWYVLYQTNGYNLSFCAYEKDWPKVQDVFRQMIESFSVEQNTSP